MKHIRHAPPILLAAMLLFSPALALAEEGFWDKAREVTSESWEATKKGVEEAAEWTSEKSGKAWEATREGATDAGKWTREQADKVWHATREGMAEVLDGLQGKDDGSRETGHRDSRIF